MRHSRKLAAPQKARKAIGSGREKLRAATAWLRGKKYAAPEVLGRLGGLEVRLARNAAEIRKCQALRYKVFYKEQAAKPTAKAKMLRRDADRLDPFCDHVLVIDNNAEKKNPLSRKKPRVIGTYRLLRQDVAEKNRGFYSEDEYDILPLVQRHGNLQFLELGRSCVLKPYRTKRTVELLWHGIWTYVQKHNIGALVGCASFEGTDPEKHAEALSYLHHFHSADEKWHARALPARYVDMNRRPKVGIDVGKTLLRLPPLIKGYMRLGAMAGEGAVIDHQFGTIDVLMILPVSKISDKYIDYFGNETGRFGHNKET